MQNQPVRERLFTMRMSEEEWQRADALAKHFGLNLAGVIRMVLKEKARELGVEPAVTVPPPAVKTPRKRGGRS